MFSAGRDGGTAYYWNKNYNTNQDWRFKVEQDALGISGDQWCVNESMHYFVGNFMVDYERK